MKRAFTFLLALLMISSILPIYALEASATEIETTAPIEATQPVEENLPPEETESETSAPDHREVEQITPDKSGSCGENLTWLLDDSGILTISGTGSMAECKIYSYPWSSYNKEIRILVVNEGVTNIAAGAFYECKKLTDLTIAGSVKTIGRNAFENCSNLVNITFHEGLETIDISAFGDCESLTTITFPNGLTHLSGWAFMNCTNLKNVSIPNSILSIDRTTFQSCSKLNYTTYDNAKYLGNSDNPYCALISATDEIPSCTIHSNTVIITGGAFQHNQSLEAIVIPENVKGIGSAAFSSCYKLKSANIPDNIIQIDSFAFSGCKNLATVSIGKNVRRIGEDAFKSCENLTEVKIEDLAAWCKIEFDGATANPLYYGSAILYLNGKAVKNVEYPKGATAVNPFAFANYQLLTSIKLPDSVKYIGECAFADCTNLSTVTLGKGVESIAWGAFAYCGKLKRITIPASVITIDDDAFEYSGLTSLTLSEGLKNIGNSAFVGCTQLKSVTIPGSVESIGNNVFRECTALTSATLKSGVPYVSESMFHDCANLKTVSLPDTIQYIDTYAFYRNHSLSSIKIPNGVERIGDSAFGSGDLKSITIPGSVKIIGSNAFSGSELKTATICEGVVTIEDNAFFACYWLSDITIPSTVTTIGTGAFDKCYRMKSAVIGSGVTTIPAEMFHGCDELNTVTIPATVNEIGTDAFARCGKLKTVYFAGDPEAWATLSSNSTELQGATVHFPKDISKLSAPRVAVQNDGVTLYWCDVAYAQAYAIYRSTSKSGKYTQVATVTNTTWADPSGTQGTSCYYKVIAQRTEPNPLQSGFSNVVSIAYKCDAPEIAVENGSTGKPVISWEQVSGAKKYTVYRATTAGGKYTKLGTSTKLTYTDSKAKAGSTYFYKVIANAASSKYNSGYSNIVSCSVICGAPKITAKADTATGKPSLSWKKVDAAAGYRILRQLPGEEDFTVIAEQTGTTFLDTTAPIDTKCVYTVQVIGKTPELDSQMSEEAAVTSGIAQPKLKTAIDASGKPELRWQTVEGAVRYEIYRSTKSSKGYTLLATVEATGYTDDTVAPGKTYYYKVVALGAVSESAESAYAKLSGKCATPEISVETGTSGKPVISWEKVDGAKKYTIYRATSENGKYKKLGTTKNLTYTDTKASAGSVYFYKIVANASSSKYNSIYSNIVSCGVYCAVPTAKYSNNASGQPVVSWSKVSGAKKYKVMYMDVTDYVGSAFGPDFENDHQVTYTTKTSFTLPDTEPGRLYMISVVAVAASEDFSSQPSETEIIRAVCATPKLSGKVGANKKPVISWKEVDGAVQYIVLRSTKKSKGYEVIAEDVEGTSFEDLTALKGKTYYYKVIAVDCSGTESAESAYAKVKSK